MTSSAKRAFIIYLRNFLNHEPSEEESVFDRPLRDLSKNWLSPTIAQACIVTLSICAISEGRLVKEAYLDLQGGEQQTNDSDKARKAYQTFLELAPNSPSASYVKQRIEKL